ncbi:LHFPL tetraspan subfamily member 6 protein-like [Mya arenaria]|uniref:LHFPL tetraspan subfamily member 6 protein-like n=1 Tax=Mya arenaria TaxID=6604 RepID=UPI0022DFAA06|nr:LHFPL tetraspan subfamily member 6 protein-like [Mya arenaria]
MSGLSGIGVFWAFTSILSATISCVGYFMPHWFIGRITLHQPGKSPEIVPVHFGIFRRCNYPYIGDDGKLTIIHECGRYTAFSDIPSVSWQITTLLVGAGCCLCFLVALTAMFGVCVKGVVIPTVARTAGIIQMCSGFLMSAGVGIYPNGWDSPEVKQACGHTSKSYNLGDCSLSWCFYVTSAGIVMTFMCAALSFHAPKRKQIPIGYAL